jgi:hypothetical protein
MTLGSHQAAVGRSQIHITPAEIRSEATGRRVVSPAPSRQHHEGKLKMSVPQVRPPGTFEQDLTLGQARSLVQAALKQAFPDTEFQISVYDRQRLEQQEAGS